MSCAVFTHGAGRFTHICVMVSQPQPGGPRGVLDSFRVEEKVITPRERKDIRPPEIVPTTGSQPLPTNVERAERMTLHCHSPRWLRLLLLGSTAQIFVLPQGTPPGRSKFPSRRAGRLDQFEASGDGSGQVVSKILETGVRLLLRRYDLVRVKVQSRWDQLIRGRVEAVELSGKQWCTKLQLRARSLVVSASSAALDYGELLQGRVTLTEVAKGSAEAIFDAQEFGDFLIYPQVSEAAPVVSGAKVLFSERGVEIDSSAEELTFQGRHAGQAFRARLTVDGGQRPKVSLHSAQLAEAM
eukprot:s1460_g3.t1